MAWLYTFSGYRIEMRVPWSFAPQPPEERGYVSGFPAFFDFWHVITKITLFLGIFELKFSPKFLKLVIIICPKLKSLKIRI